MPVLNAVGPAERQSVVDADYMAQALQLAHVRRYDCLPNPHVGCVIVKNGKVIGEGATSPAGEAHAEINALNIATLDAKGATVYVTLEPCCHTGRTGPCTTAIINAQVARVVIATLDANPLVSGKGVKLLEQAGIEVSVGIGQAAALDSNRDFFHRMQTDKPFVRLKVAMSLDGHTAMASGESKWITSQAARQDVHRLRLEAGAVLTGIDTVLADDPQMTARLPETKRQPLRVVLDSQNRMPEQATLLKEAGTTLLFQSKPNNALRSDTVETVLASMTEDNRVNLQSVLIELGKREINQVLIEAGATLSGAFIQQGLVDELVVYMAPDIMGSDARSAFNIPGLTSLAEKHAFEIKDSRLVGRDLKLTLAL